MAIPDTIDGNPVTSIGNNAFENCASLTAIEIPDTVTSIGIGAFRNCTSLTSITIPNGVTSIAVQALFGCSSLTNITLGECVTSIGSSAFATCTSLADITIPDGVTSIGRSAFSVCTSLTDITIPASLTSLGDFAFYRCFSLASITFRGAAPLVGENTFNSAGAGAKAYVYQQFANSFGGFGSTWQRLPVEAVSSTIETTITGSGRIEGDGSFANGTTITLTATPDDGQVFVAWTGGASGSENPLTFTVESDLAVGAIFIEPADYGLVTQEIHNEVVSERDARPTADQLAAVVAERDARPTADQLAAVEAERDARYTEEQIRALSPDYTMGLNEAGNVEVKISFIASSDATNFTPFPVTAESLTVVDGKICMELPPDEGAFFYRFRIE